MHNQSQQEDSNSNLSESELKQLLFEIQQFQLTKLYSHFKAHFRTLYDDTVTQIVEERLKGPETLYTRESWIGEARAVKVHYSWFDDLQETLKLELREKEQ